MEITNPKPFVFVLMPFSDKFADVYEVGIKQACKDAGAYCERVDEQTFDENILERVYNQIAKADVVVADMTGRNPNVFYEVGYAHALNKRVVLLTQKANDIPFDLTHYPHIIYGGKIAALKSQLESRLRWCIENPRDGVSVSDSNIQLTIKDVTSIVIPHYEVLDTRTTVLNIDMYNRSGKIVDADSFSLALIAPEQLHLEEPLVRSIVELSDGRFLHNLMVKCRLFPGGMDTFQISFYPADEHALPLEGEIIIRLFTESWPNDFPFNVETYKFFS
jgi:Nucleoside 2-deoxyribosyltransferase